jgi:predicted nucleotidyltransferase
MALRRYRDRCQARRALLATAAEELATVCSRLPDVLAVYVYGSYARDAVGPASDLDALIVRDTELPRFQREDDIRRFLRTAVGFDLLVVRPDEFSERLPANSVGRTILTEAKLLYAV